MKIIRAPRQNIELRAKSTYVNALRLQCSQTVKYVLTKSYHLEATTTSL